MSISVVSSTSAKIANTTSPTANPSSGASFGDFSALLSGQTLAPETDILAASIAEPITTDSTRDDAKVSGDELLDPSILAAMLGLHPPPPASGTAQVSTNSSGVNADSHKDGIEALSTNLLAKEANSNATPNGAALDVTAKQIDTERQPQTEFIEAANIAADSNEQTAFLNNLESAMHNTAHPLEKPNPTQTTIATQLSHSAWPDQFSEKIVWLAKNDQQSAQININPPQLGPVQITLNLNGDQASAIFASPHPEVRQAIEAALPQLREMLSSAGINLGDANVGSNLAQQNQGNPFLNSNGTPSGDENAILPANEKASGIVMNQTLHRGRGLVDLFA